MKAATIVKVEPGVDYWTVEVKCPYCQKTHYHTYDPESKDQERVAHCESGTRGRYILQDDYELSKNRHPSQFRVKEL